jgi:hypothetical protein
MGIAIQINGCKKLQLSSNKKLYIQYSSKRVTRKKKARRKVEKSKKMISLLKTN